MKKLITLVLLGLALTFSSACGEDNGACLGLGEVDDCIEDVTRERCDKMDGVNGARWTFHPGKSCTEVW